MGTHAMIVRRAHDGLESTAVNHDIPWQAATVVAFHDWKGSSAGSAQEETTDPRRDA